MSESIALNLDGRWKLRDFTPGQGLAAGADLPDHDDADWHRASVPGDVHTALVEVGRLAPPFYNMNLETCQWLVLAQPVGTHCTGGR
jgi:beta-mannosidase